MLVNQATIRNAETELDVDFQGSKSRDGYDVAAPEHRTIVGQQTIICLAAKWLAQFPAIPADEWRHSVRPGRRKFANTYWLKHRFSDEAALLLGNDAYISNGAFMVAAHLADFDVQSKRGDVSGWLNLSERAIESIFQRYSAQIELEGREYRPKHRP